MKTWSGQRLLSLHSFTALSVSRGHCSHREVCGPVLLVTAEQGVGFAGDAVSVPSARYVLRSGRRVIICGVGHGTGALDSDGRPLGRSPV